LHSKETHEIETFHGAFKVGFSFASGKGGVDTSSKETLIDKKVEFSAEITCGDIDPPQSAVLFGFDSISGFLEGLRRDPGGIKIYRCPIEVDAQSYWKTLLKYPKTRGLLKETSGTPAEAPFGVPAGTVIAWWPPPGSIRYNPGEAPIVEPPVGWDICDGRPGTPNLSDRFILGTTSGREIGVTDGSRTHTHSMDPHTNPENISWGGYPKWTRNVDSRIGAADLFPQGHAHPVHAADVLPPFVKIVYIIKKLG
jgi:hypothetical protein